MTLPRSKELFKYNKDIDKLLIWHPVTLPFLFISERLRKWDLLIDLNEDVFRRSVLTLKFLKPTHSIAFHNVITQKNYEITVKNYPKEKHHIIKRLSLMLKVFGIKFYESELKPVVYTNEKIINELKKEIKKK